jgi:hypothetical protein
MNTTTTTEAELKAARFAELEKMRREARLANQARFDAKGLPRFAYSTRAVSR